MRIVQLNYDDIKGGAARAAYRLHLGLRQFGHDSIMLVREKFSTDPSVITAGPYRSKVANFEEFCLSNVLQALYINNNRTDLTNTLFSLGYPGYDLSNCSIIQDADVINLHWIPYYQSPITLQRLFKLGKPVVWTLHDQWPFTGGCHYSAGCDKYLTGCTACPQLDEDDLDLVKTLFDDKLALFEDAPLTIVTPSKWLASCARESRLFRKLRVEAIPNSVETDIFYPRPKQAAKEALGISNESVTMLFGAASGNEKRKGFHELLAAITLCQDNPEFQQLVKAGRIKILCFGEQSNQIDSLSIPIVSLGRIGSDNDLRTIYSAADMFVLPSLEDNLPNTMLEAMGCGTPVIAFNVGGMPDLIIDGITGKLVPLLDIHKMSAAILDLVFNSDVSKIMGERASTLIQEKYNLNMQAEQYSRLYHELIGHNAVVDNATKPKQYAKNIVMSVETKIGSTLQENLDMYLTKAVVKSIEDKFCQHKYSPKIHAAKMYSRLKVYIAKLFIFAYYIKIKCCRINRCTN